MRKQFQRTLTKQGFKFKLSTKVVSGEVAGEGVKLEVEPAQGGDRETLEADVVLVSAGARLPPPPFLSRPRSPPHLHFLHPPVFLPRAPPPPCSPPVRPQGWNRNRPCPVCLMQL